MTQFSKLAPGVKDGALGMAKWIRQLLQECKGLGFQLGRYGGPCNPSASETVGILRTSWLSNALLSGRNPPSVKKVERNRGSLVLHSQVHAFVPRRERCPSMLEHVHVPIRHAYTCKNK